MLKFGEEHIIKEGFYEGKKCIIKEIYDKCHIATYSGTLTLNDNRYWVTVEGVGDEGNDLDDVDIYEQEITGKLSSDYYFMKEWLEATEKLQDRKKRYSKVIELFR